MHPVGQGCCSEQGAGERRGVSSQLPTACPLGSALLVGDQLRRHRLQEALRDCSFTREVWEPHLPPCPFTVLTPYLPGTFHVCLVRSQPPSQQNGASPLAVSGGGCAEGAQ